MASSSRTPLRGYAPLSARRTRGGGGQTARVIPWYVESDAGRTKDLAFDLFGVRWKRVTPRKALLPSTQMTPAAYLKLLFKGKARFVAAGGYGVTYKVQVTRSNRAAFTHLARHLSNALVISIPAVGSTALIKIAIPSKSERSSARFVVDNAREASAHVHLWRAPAVRINGQCPVVVRAKKYVPRFYSFGIDMQRGMAVTVMEYVKNSVSLRKVHITPEIFNELEEALGAFYVAAVDHSDLHLENILVHDGYHIKIIDYGFAVRLPETIRKKFVAFYASPKSSLSLNEAAKKFARPHANAIQWKRFDGNLSFYNPSYAALRAAWHYMTPADQDALRAFHENAGQIIACAWKRATHEKNKM